MAVKALKFTQLVEELHSLDAAHNLPTMNLIKSFTAGLATPIDTGTPLKLVAGAYEPWIQDTDAATLIVAVFSGPSELDTNEDEQGLVRLFGPVQKEKLVAWTVAGGATTAPVNTAALAQLETIYIYPL